MTREEAIKEIKSWAIPSKNGRKVLETLIPELAESEDERARKWLLDYAIEMIAGLESDISLSTYDGIKGHDPEAEAELAQWQKARAYLEKQKEPHNTKRNALFDKCVENCDPEVMKRVSDEVDEMLENEVMKAIEDVIRVYGKTQGGWIAGYDMDTLVVHLRKAFAALEKKKEQKPIFRIGDTLKKKGKEYTFTIDKIQGGFYLTKDEHFFPIEEQDTWELVKQSSLPPNLDEAVFAYEDSSEYPPANQEEDRMVYDAFKAGAKWQKEQKLELYYDKELDNAAREFYLSGGAVSPIDSTGLVPIVRMAEFGATWMKERMEKEQKPCWNPTEEDVALFNKAITTNASLSPQERAKLDILRMKFKHRPVIEQKEQKPAEWGEKHIADVFEKVGLAKIVREQGNDDLTNAVQSAMLELSKVENTEWSEEDEDNLNRVIRVLEDNDSDWKELSDWLKSLSPQPKPEWNEEDKRKLNRIYEILGQAAYERPFGSSKRIIGDKEAVELQDFLKSLRPFWKPSEEEMRTLNIVVSDYRHACTKDSDKKAKILKSLLEQLEKL